MPSLKSVLATSVVASYAIVNAHMLMASPQAYGKPNKSPLAADGSDFPCKATSNAGAPETSMPIGQQQILSFNGTAVHGGGSCQISLTTDTPATKNSKWMVIHPIEGGCPARNTPGNLPEGADPDTTPDPDTYKYTIPAGVAPGAYTLAWTWFNEVGNREMYMNCAAIKVTGGGSGKRDAPRNGYEGYVSDKLSERAAASFPEMFVANIGNGCTTGEGGDVKFPNPGASVETNQGYIPKAPVGNCGAGDSSSGSSSGNPKSGSSSSSSSANSNSGASNAPSMPVAPPSGASSAASPAADTAPAAGNSQSGSGAAAPPSSGKASTGANTGACSTPGRSICSPDGAQVGTCSQAKTVTWTKLAQGTKCSGGNVVAA